MIHSRPSGPCASGAGRWDGSAESGGVGSIAAGSRRTRRNGTTLLAAMTGAGVDESRPPGTTALRSSARAETRSSRSWLLISSPAQQPAWRLYRERKVCSPQESPKGGDASLLLQRDLFRKPVSIFGIMLLGRSPGANWWRRRSPCYSSPARLSSGGERGRHDRRVK